MSAELEAHCYLATAGLVLRLICLSARTGRAYLVESPGDLGIRGRNVGQFRDPIGDYIHRSIIVPFDDGDYIWAAKKCIGMDAASNLMHLWKGTFLVSGTDKDMGPCIHRPLHWNSPFAGTHFVKNEMRSSSHDR